jgi:CheY-like chemotaxis protein
MIVPSMTLFDESSPEVNRGYEEFLKDETSPVLVIIYLVIFNFALIIRCLVSFSILSGFQLILTLPGYLYIYAVLQHQYKSLKPLPIRTIHLGNFINILCAIITGLILYRASLSEDCSGFACDPQSTPGLQPNFLAIAMSNTVFTPMTIKSHTRWSTLFAILIKILFLFISCLKVHSRPGTYIALASIMFFQTLLLYYYEAYTKRMYLINLRIEYHVRETMVKENEKIIFEMHSKEMKSLIGNVAHDLKSPLQAFTTELDTLLGRFQKGRNDCEIDSVLLCKSISSFMVMLINRAIDYTKATSGIGLKASLGTFHLMETMEWVVRCAERCNRKVPIRIQSCSFFSSSATSPALAPPICQFVISDRQWLLENLLCLVSNAQKFTSKGEIVIRCCVVPSSSACLRTLSPSRPLENESIHISDPPPPSSTQDVLPLLPLSSPPPDGPFLRFEVEDGGIGISDEKKKELFRPFKQAQSGAGGTGLGLYSLSQRILVLGGGCGVVDRRDEKQGACFWFTIPYRPDRMVESQNSEVSNRVLLASSTDDRGEIEKRPTHSFQELQIGQFENSRRTEPPSVSVGTDRLNSTQHRSSKATVRQFSDAEDTSRHIKPSLDPSCLPSRPSSHPPSRSPSTHSAHHLLPPLQQTNRILLVEDSPLIQKTTMRALSRAGYQVDLATNGLECLEMTERTAYRIVLMDIHMPLMDGLEATTRLRERERSKGTSTSPTLPSRCQDLEAGVTVAPPHHHLLVIGLSANSDAETKEQALSAGMDEYLTKPLSVEDLKLCLRRLHVFSTFELTNGEEK